MSWLLVFVSGLLPIVLLSVMVLAESVRHAERKLCTVKAPVRRTQKIRISQRNLDERAL
jgi:hypothetical protein